MGKLLKYEFRKTRNLKLVIIVLACLFEAVLLVGMRPGSLIRGDRTVVIGTMGLFFTAGIGMAIIAIYSTVILYRDLNTRQSYMLFLTPHSSWEILGAKFIENLVSFFVMGLFFLLLALLDMRMVMKYIPDLSFSELINSIDPDSLQFSDIAGALLYGVLEMLAWVLAAFNAVIIQAALFNGKKYGGWLAFLLFIVIAYLQVWMSAELVTSFASGIALASVWAACLYALGGWIMQGKLSV